MILNIGMRCRLSWLFGSVVLLALFAARVTSFHSPIRHTESRSLAKNQRLISTRTCKIPYHRQCPVKTILLAKGEGNENPEGPSKKVRKRTVLRAPFRRLKNSEGPFRRFQRLKNSEGLGKKGRKRKLLGTPFRELKRLVRKTKGTEKGGALLDEDKVQDANFKIDNRAILGDRWAVSSPKVDLSGKFVLINSKDFQKEYDVYLADLDQPTLVRTIAVKIIGSTSEEMKQTDDGRTLFIRGRNPRGVWDRDLIASGSDEKSTEFNPILTPLVTLDGDKVVAEAWWEEDGTVHRSWLRGGKKYGGGDFESRRYLEDDGNVYVCETTFHRTGTREGKASVTWRFRRKGTNN